MNQKDTALLKLRLAMLDKKERKEIRKLVTDYIVTKKFGASVSADDVKEILNRVLIEKYGELAVYDYLRNLNQ